MRADTGPAGPADDARRADAATVDDLLLSATWLSGYLACPHLAAQTLAARLGAGPKPPRYEDPGAEVLREKGETHERRVLWRYRDQGLTIASVTSPPDPEEGGPGRRTPEHYAAAAAATIDAMHSGADIIYQGTLFDGRWLGRADFMRRVERPSPAFGEWSYEVVDAKLARQAKGEHILQIALYTDLLAKAQGVEPEHMHLVLGGVEPQEESFRYNDFAAYYRLVRRRFDAHLADQAEAIERAGRARRAEDADSATAAITTYPEPCAHCPVCDWQPVCRARWKADDHLSLVAGIARRQRDELAGRDIDTLGKLGVAKIPLEPPLASSGTAATERVQKQARIQLKARRAGPEATRYEFLKPVVPNEGLAALPEPSAGDLFLDFEADRFHEWIGLEYLLGYCEAGGGRTYTALWALDRAEEKAMFERFVDFVVARRRRCPDLHIYHYAPYEETALKRLSLRHSTRVEEVDDLLRAGVLVDLYRVVRQGIRASVESYSIKNLEPFYGFEREVDLRDAGSALKQFEAYLALRGRDAAEADAIRARVAGYNRDDCVSTLRLRDWLERLRDELAEKLEADIPRPAPEEPAAELEPSLVAARVADLEARLTKHIPAAALAGGDDGPALTGKLKARLLLARLLDFHRREDKATWWEYFARCEMSEDELIEDRSCLGGLRYMEQVGAVKQSLVHRYRFPEQDFELADGDAPHIAGRRELAGTIVALDERRKTVDIKRGRAYPMPDQMSLVPLDNVRTDILRDSLLRLADAVLEDTLGTSDRTRLAADLLLRRAPKVGRPTVGTLRLPGEDEVTAARRLVRALDRTVLAIQGPPGSGKTYTGARMICDLLADGKRVGVTATSHKVINNLLTEACKVTRERGLAFRGLQKAAEHQWCKDDLIERIGSAQAVAAALSEARAEGTAALAAGTSWLWAHEELGASADVLFVDEAGQFSLANALAVAQAAGSLVLLGDPQQLEQPIKGIHPEGAGASALEHLLDGAATIAPEQGLFLARTWRLHPDICRFTSELFYEGKLAPQESLNRQAVTGPEPFGGTGLRFVPVEHAGNRNHSPEEVAVVKRLVDELLAAGAAWTDRHGATHPIGLEDILIVAPYNAQVGALREDLPEDARVGTVDKFQGQEAPIVIYSMATSRPEDAPRGMEFLYNASRLNVATSRARCVAVIVANPALLEPACRTPPQMLLANGYCRVGEVAG
jgi:uncharacterized protein